MTIGNLVGFGDRQDIAIDRALRLRPRQHRPQTQSRGAAPPPPSGGIVCVTATPGRARQGRAPAMTRWHSVSDSPAGKSLVDFKTF